MPQHGPENSTRPAKRPRASRACQACRARKIRCNELIPCAYCGKHGKPCQYETQDAQPVLAHSRKCGNSQTTERSSLRSKDDKGMTEQFFGKSSIAAFVKDATRMENDNPIQPIVKSNGITTRQSGINLLPLSFRLELIDIYLNGLHIIHPMIIKADFLDRCERLWMHPENSDKAFEAVYYAILALGAYTSAPSVHGGTERKDLSISLFETAKDIVLDLSFRSSSSLELTQASYFLAQHCMHMLQVHECYMFLGLATRHATSIGLHDFHSEDHPDGIQRNLSWWSIVSIESELCLAFGRLSTCGIQEIDNLLPTPLEFDAYQEKFDMWQTFPMTAGNKINILLARLCRQISWKIYGQNVDLSEQAKFANECVKVLDSVHTDPVLTYLHLDLSLEEYRQVKTPEWVDQQRIIFFVRIQTVKMLARRPLFLYHLQSARLRENEGPQAYEAEAIAVKVSAQHTIRYMHASIEEVAYNWSYNITHIFFSVVTLGLWVFYMDGSRHACQTEIQDIEIAFEAMRLIDVCAAERSRLLLRKILGSAEHRNRQSAALLGLGMMPSGGLPESHNGDVPSDANMFDFQDAMPVDMTILDWDKIFGESNVF